MKILPLVIAMILFLSNNAFAFYDGYWKSKNNKNIIHIESEIITVNNKPALILKKFEKNGEIIMLCIDKEAFEKAKEDEKKEVLKAAEKGPENFWWGSVITIKKITDDEIIIDNPITFPKEFVKTTQEEANELLPPKK